MDTNSMKKKIESPKRSQLPIRMKSNNLNKTAFFLSLLISFYVKALLWLKY